MSEYSEGNTSEHQPTPVRSKEEWKDVLKKKPEKKAPVKERVVATARRAGRIIASGFRKTSRSGSRGRARVSVGRAPPVRRAFGMTRLSGGGTISPQIRAPSIHVIGPSTMSGGGTISPQIRAPSIHVIGPSTMLGFGRKRR